MEKIYLGKSGLEVSKICFGTLPMGPLQYNISMKDGVELIQKAYESGITYFDTAQNYRTYDYLRNAFNGNTEKAIISTKSKAFTFNDMDRAVKEALKNLNRDYIDIFYLHADQADGHVQEVL